MSTPSGRLVGRRWFLTHTARGAVGIAVLGVAACSRSEDRPESGGTPTQSGTAGTARGLAWSRVDLGFVAAYVLVRGREAAVVDTGVEGSADAIGEVVEKAGPGWSGVRHVILTHKHPDHVGSVGDVLDAATQAKGYVGAPDLSEVDAPRALTPLRDGEDVFGLRVVATPGHTAGHMSVFDGDTRVLVAGDALTNTDGLAGSNPQFTENKAAAVASVRKLAGLAPRTILVGHGDPVVEDATATLQKLASSLG